MSDYRMDHGHYAWSALPTRRPLRWPNGARIAVAFVVSLGHYEADPPAGAYDPATFRPPLRSMPYPDYPTVTHREYGHRVGIFRMLDAFDAHGVRATAAIDALTAQGYPRLVAECRRRDWDIIGHGVSQRRALTDAMSETDERAYVRESLDAVTKAAGRAPVGWLSPEHSESRRTPTILAEAGLSYLGDWANDDQPYLIGPEARTMVSIPFMRELSDAHMHATRKIAMPRWAALVHEAFDILHGEGADSGRLFALPLHPWCIGQPHRIVYLERLLAHIKAHEGVWWATGAEIATSYREQLA